MLTTFESYRALNEVNKNFKEFQEDKFWDKVTPYANYGGLPKPVNEEEKSNDRYFKQSAMKKYDEIFGTSYYREDADYSYLVPDSNITEIYSGDVIHALIHETVTPNIYKKFAESKYQTTDYTLEEHLYEALVFHLQHGYHKTSPTYIAKFLTGKIPSTTIDNVLIDFFYTFVDEFSHDNTLKYFNTMVKHIVNSTMTDAIQKGILESLISIHNKYKNAVTEFDSMTFFTEVAERFIRVYIHDHQRQEILTDVVCSKLMQWYNFLKYLHQKLSLK